METDFPKMGGNFSVKIKKLATKLPLPLPTTERYDAAILALRIPIPIPKVIPSLHLTQIYFHIELYFRVYYCY